MMETSRTNFVKRYKPGAQARVELVNGRILEVVHDRYFDAGTRVILQDGKIKSMPGLAGEPTGITPDFSIDLQGKTVLPSLYNTHCHLATAGPTIIPGLREMRANKGHKGQQQDKNMADCLAHGITHIRDAWWGDLCENRALKERISKSEIPGPRILQAVAVGLPGSYLQEKSLMSKFLMRNAGPSENYAGSVTLPMNANEQQVRDAVDIAIDERGADVIKTADEATSIMTGKPIPQMTIEQLSAVADQARRRGVQSTMHHTTANDTMPPCTPAMMDLELLMFDHLLKGRSDGKQLSGAEAVKVATINSARSLGVEEEFGSIETGKTADLIILDGDPLEDFRLIGSRVAALFMDGQLVINNCGLEVESNRKA